MHWLNEPAHWSHSDSQIVVKTDPKTDFWRITHYGFIRDSGHFYWDAIATDFDVEVKIRGAYKDLYDQAGLMIRADAEHWIKTGIEYVDGVKNLSAVVTNTYSDWSITPLPSTTVELQLRAERRNEAIQIFYLNHESRYTLSRMAYLPTSNPLQVGVMAASPDGDGYEVIFDHYQLTPV
jgi:uncharacterized protein